MKMKNEIGDKYCAPLTETKMFEVEIGIAGTLPSKETEGFGGEDNFTL
ncbi:MAG: hypothetical protein SOZ00_05450 [Tidjanibacter sp.]|nr:hypothetical protein [Tidjanibacter sp.]